MKKQVLNQNEKDFLAALTRYRGNQSKAAMEVYNCSTMASARALGHSKKKTLEKKLGEDFFDSMGLSKELIAKSLVEDIKANKGKRVPELTLASKLRGDLVDKKEVTETHTYESYIAFLEEEDEQPRISIEAS